jgi:hypothetical protein
VILLWVLIVKPNFSAAERQLGLLALADAPAASQQADSVTLFWFLIAAGELEASLSVERPEVGLTQVDLYHSPAADLCLVVSMCQTQVVLQPAESHPALSVCWT